MRGHSSSGGSRGISSFGGSRGHSSSVSRGRSTSSFSSHHHSSGHGSGSVIVFGGRTHINNPIVSAIIGCVVLSIMLFSFVIVSIFSLTVSYGKTTGEVEDNTLINGFYYTTYEYEVDGIEYEQMSKEGWEFEEEGETAVIYYRKGEPTYITEIEHKTEPNYVSFAICLAISAGVLIGLIALIRYIEKKKHYEESATVDGAEKEQESNVVTCPYCGAVYEKTKTKCPGCGTTTK